MVDQARIRSLKRRLFERDGWSRGYDVTNHRQIWLAVCAFPGCDTIVNWDTASLDHYPIPKRFGGPWSMSNLRLACKPCNTSDKAAKMAGAVGQIIPQGLKPAQKKAWWIANQYRLDELLGIKHE